MHQPGGKGHAVVLHGAQGWAHCWLGCLPAYVMWPTFLATRCGGSGRVHVLMCYAEQGECEGGL